MKQTVLLIDDSEMSHEMVHLMIKSDVIDVVSARSAAEGLIAAEALQPDLILLDIEMPEMTGFEVCQTLKEKSETANIPVIFLSGKLDADTKAQGFAMGAIDYVTKPFHRVELVARISAALRTKRSMDHLSRQALIDPLTNAWNRAYFDQRLTHEISRAARHARPLGCIMLDIDHFKKINDTFGHPGGDHVLKGVTLCIAAAVRDEDVVARIGGEEFAILVPDTARFGTLVVAERIRRNIEIHPFDFRGQPITATCSVGVSNTECHLPAAHEFLVDRADEALYRAKNAGRNRIAVEINDFPGDADAPAAIMAHNIFDTAARTGP